MWYSARLLYESVVDDNASGEALFEEKVVVFRCNEPNELADRLLDLARKREVEYDNIEGNKVMWLFREILEVQDLDTDEIEDGTEVYFRHWHDPDEGTFEIIRHTHGDPWWLSASKERGDGAA